jgi:hypothetical protein
MAFFIQSLGSVFSYVQTNVVDPNSMGPLDPNPDSQSGSRGQKWPRTVENR